jgi:hypothetical protein
LDVRIVEHINLNNKDVKSRRLAGLIKKIAHPKLKIYELKIKGTAAARPLYFLHVKRISNVEQGIMNFEGAMVENLIIRNSLLDIRYSMPAKTEQIE